MLEFKEWLCGRKSGLFIVVGWDKFKLSRGGGGDALLFGYWYVFMHDLALGKKTINEATQKKENTQSQNNTNPWVLGWE